MKPNRNLSMRVPRKKKKVAKKLKAKNDALVMAMTAVVTAQSLAQMAVLRSTPFEIPAIKALKAVQIIQDSAKGVASCMNQIKHWTSFVKNYRASTETNEPCL